MYSELLIFHSLTRWLVLFLMGYAIFRAWTGHFQTRPFTKSDNSIRHWTATVAHIQLVLGIILYTQSPFVKAFWSSPGSALKNLPLFFYGAFHLFLMTSAIVILTIGSALAKRQSSDPKKFKTMLIWFLISFAIILVAIPWPFSPLSSRPYFRTF
ncbi:hypothetical protein KFE98_05430 [bacterium SCSIO 12741]|nr:hypothetical protein KFE98_05430 [bacterium SCSIO 12741]